MESLGKVKDRPHVILGQNIAERRSRLGINQDGFADRAGIGSSSLKDIERGVSEGHFESRKAIASALGCTVAELYMEPGSKTITFSVSEIADFLSRLSGLSPELQRVVYAIVYQDASLARGLKIDLKALFQIGSSTKK